MCKDASIKTQMLSEFDPTENELGSIEACQTKMQIYEENGQKYLLE